MKPCSAETKQEDRMEHITSHLSHSNMLFVPKCSFSSFLNDADTNVPQARNKVCVHFLHRLHIYYQAFASTVCRCILSLPPS